MYLTHHMVLNIIWLISNISAYEKNHWIVYIICYFNIISDLKVTHKKYDGIVLRNIRKIDMYFNIIKILRDTKYFHLKYLSINFINENIYIYIFLFTRPKASWFIYICIYFLPVVIFVYFFSNKTCRWNEMLWVSCEYINKILLQK